MARIGKISPIQKEYPVGGNTLESALSRYGMTRSPGTGVMIFPFLEADGSYRTALDPDSLIYKRIRDVEMRNAKMAYAKKLLEDLQIRTGLRLDGRSPYYHYGYVERSPEGKVLTTRTRTVDPYKLIDGDNLFNLDDPFQAITYYWVSVHPRIAASMEAYKRGDYGPDIQFFVKDDEIEADTKYSKKKTANDAIIKFSSLSPAKRKKICRLCDLPVSDDSREEVDYNLMDDFLKSKEIAKGPYKGSDPIRIFGMYVDLNDNDLHVKDLVAQAFENQIYRLKKNNRVFEGELEVFESKEALIQFLLEDKNQTDILDLEKKLKMKKLAKV